MCLLRQLAINNPPRLRRTFVCLKSCCVERIAGYVSEATRLKTDKKASTVGGLFIASCLRSFRQKQKSSAIIVQVISCTFLSKNISVQQAKKIATMNGDDLNVCKDSVTKSLNQLSRLCFRLRKAQSVISIIYVLQMGVS